MTSIRKPDTMSRNIFLTPEQQEILDLLHIEVCGACGKRTLFVDILGGEKRCMNCNGRFRNKRAE